MRFLFLMFQRCYFWDFFCAKSVLCFLFSLRRNNKKKCFKVFRKINKNVLSGVRFHCESCGRPQILFFCYFSISQKKRPATCLNANLSEEVVFAGE